MVMRMVVVCLAFGLVLFGGAAAAGATGERAAGKLIDGAGKEVGTVELEQTASGVTVSVSVSGLTPGSHGIHLHAVGTCAGPDFTSAGGHFNPTGKKHGLNNPEGPHAGDLPNLTAGGDGRANYRGSAGAVTIAAGPNSLFDADGAALVIHAGPDDNMTDPAGNSGGRVACAVLTQTQAAPGMPRTGSGGLAGAASAPVALAAFGLLVLGALAARAPRRTR
jgi:Cu-Zn family superoxide dismutase